MQFRIAKVSAPAIVIPVFPIKTPAKVTPTAIPSGILWSVTASTIIVVFFNFDFIPSGLLLSKCKCGIKLSKINKNTIPSKKPIAAGIQATFPCSSTIFIDGIIKDHIEAAIITPDANPKSSFSIFLFILFLIKNTIAAPRIVPTNGINNPVNNCINHIPFYYSLFSYYNFSIQFNLVIVTYLIQTTFGFIVS